MCQPLILRSLCTGLVFALVIPVFGPAASAVQNEDQRPTDANTARSHLFEIDGNASAISLSLFPGGFTSPVAGDMTLRIQPILSPQIQPADTRRVRVAVRGSFLLAYDWMPDADFLPLAMYLDPTSPSTGWYNPYTGGIRLELNLTTGCQGGLLPMPVRMRGTLSNGFLRLEGTNGNVSDAGVTLRIHGRRTVRRPDARLSTEVGFPVAAPDIVSSWVSDGDLLSPLTCVFKRNRALMAQLGVMPPVPDVGLDGVTLTPYRPILFSIDSDQPLWSETLGMWLTHGDLLSATGQVVYTNQALLAPFNPIISTDGVGLDAVHMPTSVQLLTSVTDCCGCLLFSVERSFQSGALNRFIGHGDLLCTCGYVTRTNRQLMANFNPIAIPCSDSNHCATVDPCDAPDVPDPADLLPCVTDAAGTPCADFGLDAVYVKSPGEIWFSTEMGFLDADLGWVSDGDLLSTRGTVVRPNLALVQACEPLVDCANFGLDVLDGVHLTTGITDVDADVDDTAESDVPR